MLAIAVAVVAFSLLAVIAIPSIALHDLKENSEAIRKDADAYRQVMEIAEEQAASLQADMAVKPPSSP